MTSLVNLVKQAVAFLGARPAIVGGLVSVAVTLLAGLGFHLTQAELTGLLSTVAAVVAAFVHVQTAPAGKHEGESRETHP